MARKARDTANYFPHYADASAGDTLTALQSAYQNDGYAFWFRLLERLASADGHYIDLRNDVKYRTFAAKMYIDVEKADAIMAILVETEAIDGELWQHKVVWCQNLVNNLADVYRNRRRKIPQRPAIITQDGITTILTDDYTVTTPSNDGKNPKDQAAHEQNKGFTGSSDVLHRKYLQNKTKLNKTKQDKNSSSSSINTKSVSLEDVVKDFTANIASITPTIHGYIEAAYDLYGGEWILDAIGEAVKQNKPTWAYIEGILKNWQEYGRNNAESKYKSCARQR